MVDMEENSEVHWIGHDLLIREHCGEVFVCLSVYLR